MDGLLRRLDDLARQLCQASAGRDVVVVVVVAVFPIVFSDGHVLDEDGDALHGLVAERAFRHGELERVRDLVGQVAAGDLFVRLQGGGCVSCLKGFG